MTLLDWMPWIGLALLTVGATVYALRSEDIDVDAARADADRVEAEGSDAP